MIELNAAEFIYALPLLTGIKQKVLPYAICEGINPGRIFVDQRDKPQLAMIWSPVGYYFLAGDPITARNLTEARRVLTDIFVPDSQVTGESGFILIPSHAGWKNHLSELLPGRKVIDIFRRPFHFDPDRFAQQDRWRERIPQGFCLQPVDSDLAERVGVLASWVSVDAFMRNGLGVVLLDGDKIAGSCHSVFASHKCLEIDVQTDDLYRRRGFAFLTASAFIESCLARGQQPNWECFWENEASTALAGKLGFRAEPDYPVWYWEE